MPSCRFSAGPRTSPTAAVGSTRRRLALDPPAFARARWCWSTSGPTPASTASAPCPTWRPGTSATATTGWSSSGSTRRSSRSSGRLERRRRDRRVRAHLSGRPGQRLRDLERVRQPVLAGEVPDRRRRQRPLRRISARATTTRPSRRSAACWPSAARRLGGETRVRAPRRRPGGAARRDLSRRARADRFADPPDPGTRYYGAPARIPPTSSPTGSWTIATEGAAPPGTSCSTSSFGATGLPRPRLARRQPRGAGPARRQADPRRAGRRRRPRRRRHGRRPAPLLARRPARVGTPRLTLGSRPGSRLRVHLRLRRRRLAGREDEVVEELGRGGAARAARVDPLERQVAAEGEVAPARSGRCRARRSIRACAAPSPRRSRAAPRRGPGRPRSRPLELPRRSAGEKAWTSTSASSACPWRRTRRRPAGRRPTAGARPAPQQCRPASAAPRAGRRSARARRRRRAPLPGAGPAGTRRRRGRGRGCGEGPRGRTRGRSSHRGRELLGLARPRSRPRGRARRVPSSGPASRARCRSRSAARSARAASG